jgi:hypothetical protein
VGTGLRVRPNTLSFQPYPEMAARLLDHLELDVKHNETSHFTEFPLSENQGGATARRRGPGRRKIRAVYPARDPMR